MGARRIGQRLVDAGLIEVAQIDEALRLQVVHGARLGTNLVEHFALGLDDLARHLAEQHGLPPALAVDFDGAAEPIYRSMPPELAARWLCVPLGYVEGGAGGVMVAARDPLPADAIGELERALGLTIVPAIAPELRIFYYLEHLYGFERPNRFKRIRRDESIELPIFFDEGPDEPDDREGTPLPGAGPRQERRRFVTTLSEIDEQGEPSREVLARIPIRRSEVAFIGERAPTMDYADVADAARAIKRATGRDAVGDIVVESMRDGFGGRLDAGMILVLREGTAVGWKGFVRDGLDGLVDLVAIPLSAPSSVAAVCELGTDYVGPPMQHSPIEHSLWTVLEVQAPHQIAVVPIRLFEQTVCLLYAQASVELIGAPAEELRVLAQAVKSSFERLTRAAQR